MRSSEAEFQRMAMAMLAAGAPLQEVACRMGMSVSRIRALRNRYRADLALLTLLDCGLPDGAVADRLGICSQDVVAVRDYWCYGPHPGDAPWSPADVCLARHPAFRARWQWSRREIDLLCELYARESDRALAVRLSRTVGSVRAQASYLGLTRREVSA